MATESGASKEQKHTGNGFVRFFKRIGSWFKATALELKKVTWPKFGEVVKKTGIVLGVVFFFFIALFIMDLVLGMGHRALLGQPYWWEFWNL